MALSSDQTLRVVAINGSLRPGSFTRKACLIALEGAREAGVETALLDLRDYTLPFCDGKIPDDVAPPDLLRLRREVRAASGVILATPEYHSSLSGVLKNALDLMGFEEFEGKMLGLLGLSGGRMGAVNSLNALRTIGRSLHAWVLPEQVSIAESRRAFAADGSLRDPELAGKVRDLGKEVARFACLHNLEHAVEFLREWQQAMPNPGGSSQWMEP